jgi:hypothetical protein
MRQADDKQNRHFELRFDALTQIGSGFTFPCDARGNVDLDELSDGLRQNYLFAHTLIGRDFAMPVVRAR